MSDTKNIESLKFSKDDAIIKEMINGEIDKRIEECAKNLKKDIEVCENAIERANNNGWVKIVNKALYYTDRIEGQHVLIPDTKEKKISMDGYMDILKSKSFTESFWKRTVDFEGIKMRWLTEEEAGILFGADADYHNPLVEDSYILNGNERTGGSKYDKIFCNSMNGNHASILWKSRDNGFYQDDFSYKPNYTWYYWKDYIGSIIMVPIFSVAKSTSKACFFIINKLIPQGVSKEEAECFRKLLGMLETNQIVFEPDIVICADCIKNIKLKNVKNFYDVSFQENDILKYIEEEVALSEENLADIVKRYLDCDKERAFIDTYDEGQIYEVNRGHWELWQEVSGSESDVSQIRRINTDVRRINSDIRRVNTDILKGNTDKISVKLPKPFVARNPLADVNKSGVVGIDFGTKSTVVVLLDDNSHIRQMRIGSGNLKKEVKKSDYENPTVMEFIDIKDFMERYNEKEGRPHTLWRDITVSHSAVDGLQNSKNSQFYHSYFSDLKQWAVDFERKVRIIDQKDCEVELQNFLEIDDNGFNPIEIYAYYLGLSINNMRNGIYLDYILSYPVNYPVNVRNKIIESFKNGIKKSLPIEVQRDEECKSLFRVQAGVSEPAAYAISALKGYGFEPDEGEKYFYGIFDFGGGTTDFDFGIWRGANGKECRRSDFVIEHFGDGGDKDLGGENLLEQMAFDVFRANEKVMRENDLKFFKPSKRYAFAGSETLLDDSPTARLNIKQLMEKLRFFWEADEIFADRIKEKSGENVLNAEIRNKEENPEKIEALRAVKEGSIKVSLFDSKGNIHANVELKVDENELVKTIYDTIREGVVSFFVAVKNTFNKEQLSDINKINIFLAGNSCNSPVVMDIFEEVIALKRQEILELFKENGQDTVGEDIFEVFPALGSKEAEEKKKALGIKTDDNLKEYEKPTGKTGVAYGLIEGRTASRIKVISEIKSTDEAKFKFYIGYERRGKFNVEMERDIEYRKWVEFIDAAETDFDIFYTSLPEATTNEMDITRVKRRQCCIGKAYEDESINVYIRAAAIDEIEYAVGRSNDVIKGKYLEGPCRIKLSE